MTPDPPSTGLPQLTAGSREREVPAELHITTGTAGTVMSVAKIVAGLTTEKTLMLFVAATFGYLLYSTMQQASADKAHTARLYEDGRERERKHADEREDKMTRDRDAESAKMRTWFSEQFDAARKFEADQREKDRAAVTKLGEIINRKFGSPQPGEECEIKAP